MEKEITVVIPVYNSEKTLVELAGRIQKVFVQMNMGYEMVLVDDGSSDNSWAVIQSLKSTYGDQLKGIRLARNFGQHNALCCGFLYANTPMIITMDDDLQHLPEEIPLLVNKYKETNADVVYGMPINSQHTTIRRWGSNFIRRSSEHYKSGNVGGSAFRLLRKNIVDKITLNHSHNFIFIDAIINWYTSNIQHANVTHAQRQVGRSGYTTARLVRLYFNLLINYSAAPLRWIMWIGFLSAFISFIVGIRFIYIKFMYNVPIGYTSTIVAILFGTGLIMLSLGIIGQYIYKIYQLQYRKPAFYIQTTV